MLYEIVCLFVAALGAYGLYVILLRAIAPRGSEHTAELTMGIHVRAESSDEEIENALLLLRANRAVDELGSDPVRLVDCPLRAEILRELTQTGAALYLSYEEYYREKRK